METLVRQIQRNAPAQIPYGRVIDNLYQITDRFRFALFPSLLSDGFWFCEGKGFKPVNPLPKFPDWRRVYPQEKDTWIFDTAEFSKALAVVNIFAKRRRQSFSLILGQNCKLAAYCDGGRAEVAIDGFFCGSNRRIVQDNDCWGFTVKYIADFLGFAKRQKIETFSLSLSDNWEYPVVFGAGMAKYILMPLAQ